MENYRKVAEFKNVSEFQEYLASEHISIPMTASLRGDGTDALAQNIVCYGKTVGNRYAILPMEGWDCSPNGAPSEHTRRRWLRFARSGAKMLFGTEAAAVIKSGKSNTRQLMCIPETEKPLSRLCTEMRSVHQAKFGRSDDLMIGLQLTHSGRFSHPDNDAQLESVTAYSHPLLDKKFHNNSSNVVSDEEVKNIVRHFVQAAQVAEQSGFEFVDIKHAHGYLGHEFLSAVDRPGPYGGCFENRTRFFREIAEGIKKACPGLKIASRVSLFDILPFEKGEDGTGRPMKWDKGVYHYAFGGDGSGMEMDENLTETVHFFHLLKEYGVELVCASIGSPYYNVHMQRPAYYAVADGYAMPEHPLYNVSRHLKAVQRIKELCPFMQIIGSGYTCLQEYLPNAAEYAVSHGHADFAGIGRMVLSYPEICTDTLNGKELQKRLICRTLGECTNAPRNGMISGCYPFDDYYKKLPEALKLKSLKGKLQPKSN